MPDDHRGSIAVIVGCVTFKQHRCRGGGTSFFVVIPEGSLLLSVLLPTLYIIPNAQ